MNIAERFKKRANLAAVLSVPFIHSGLFRQYAEELGVSVDELSDEQRKEAVKKLSAITLKINRIPRQEMTKVISSASVEAKAVTLQHAGQLDSAAESELFNRAFFAAYNQELIKRIVKHTASWSIDEPCDANNKALFLESLTLEEQQGLCIGYTDAVTEQVEQAEKNGQSSSVKDSSKDL